LPNVRTPLRAAAALFVLAGALFGVWASRVPAVTAKLELTPNELGVVLLLLALGATLAFAVAGRASDIFGPPRVARALGVAAALALILVGMAPNIASLGLSLFLFGATVGGLDVAMNSWATEVEQRRGRPVMSSLHAMYSVGTGLGAATGYLAASADLVVSAHFAIAAVLFAAICLWMAIVDWTFDRPKTARRGPIYVLPKRGLAIVAVVAFCASIGEGGMADWSAIFLVAVAQVGDADAALGFTVFSIAMVVARLLGDRFVARVGAIAAGRLSGIAATIGVLIAVVFGSFGAALVGFALMGMGYALIMPLAFSRAASDGTMARGAAIASVATLGYGAFMLGPPLIGFIADATSIRLAFGLLAAFAVLIVIFAKALGSPKVPQDQ